MKPWIGRTSLSIRPFAVALGKYNNSFQRQRMDVPTRETLRGVYHVLLMVFAVSLMGACSPKAIDVAPGGIGSSSSETHSYPLLDGRCQEYEELGTTQVPIAAASVLYIFQDETYVWLCASLPPGSYGTGDLWIDSPSIAEPLNLHVSAQLGEWLADRPEEVPTDATSDRWWNNNGWSSNIMAYGGLRSRGERKIPRFRPAEGREFQLAKERFGRGEWRLRLSLSGVASAEGGLTTIHLPSQTSEPPIKVEVF